MIRDEKSLRDMLADAAATEKRKHALQLKRNSNETRVLNFMVAIASNLPEKVFHDSAEGVDEFAYKTLDLALALNTVYLEHWEHAE
jgi:hypothetical protein